MLLIILGEIDFLGATLQLETFDFLCALCSFAFCFVALLRIPNEFDLWHAIRIKLNNSNKWFFYILFYFCYSFVVDIAGWLTFCFLFFTIIVDTIATVVNMIVPRFVPMCNFCATIYFQTFRFEIENFASLFFSAIGASNSAPPPGSRPRSAPSPGLSPAPLSIASEIRAYYSWLRVAKGCMGLRGVKTGQIATMKLHM